MSVTSGVLLAIVKQLIDDNKKLKSDQQRKTQAMQDGMMLLLKIQLIEYHEKYMNDDSIPTYVYDNFDEMYKVYQELGGNGMVKHMKEAVDKKRIVIVKDGKHDSN
jgi:prenyltransferase beta subunit